MALECLSQSQRFELFSCFLHVQALQLQSEHSYLNKSVPSAALFYVLLERAHDLPVRLTHMHLQAFTQIQLSCVGSNTVIKAFSFVFMCAAEEEWKGT